MSVEAAPSPLFSPFYQAFLLADDRRIADPTIVRQIVS
jgi:hypothetical protein